MALLRGFHCPRAVVWVFLLYSFHFENVGLPQEGTEFKLYVSILVLLGVPSVGCRQN
jgi:hypothetical protein